MKILFVTSSLEAGGAERVISIMANYWAAKGWDVTILTLAGDDVAVFYEIHRSIKILKLGLSSSSKNVLVASLNSFKRIRAIRKVIAEAAPAAVISFTDRINILSILSLIGLRIPIFVSPRTDPRQVQIGLIWKALRVLLYPIAKGVVFQTECARDASPASLNRSSYVIPNPVMRPPSAREDSSFNALISVGRLDEAKGIDLLLRAFAIVHPQFPQWRLFIVGDGPLRSRLLDLTKELGVKECVQFVGLVRNPSNYLAKSDIFVLSSRREGFPNALTEALACGLPVVAMDCCCGPREIVRHEVDGLLVPEGDISALAEGMKCLMEDASIRQRFSQRAPEILQRFGVEKVMDLWEGMLAAALSKGCQE